MACNVVSYTRNGAYKYAVLPDARMVLVPTIMRVRCTGIPAHKTVLDLPSSALPFGLVDSVVVTPCDTAAPLTLPPYRVHIRKTTGARASDKQDGQNGPHGASLVYNELAIEQDAADEDLNDVQSATGHTMHFRMIAGSSVVGVGVEFYGPPPPSFDIVYYGANAVPVDTDVDALDALLVRGAPKLAFPPLLQKDRMAVVKTRLSDAMAKRALTDSA